MPTPRPRQVLDLLSRDELLQLADEHGVIVGDRHVKAHIADQLETKGPALADLLTGLRRDRLEELSRALGLAVAGRDKASLIECLAGNFRKLPFSVDAALLRELGERLVGKPAFALAELIKNSYDADAKRVIVKLGKDSIEVVDNGHGMSLEDFKRFWMRVGSTHKQAEGTSRGGRQLTGSKGVGRLSVQFLADQFELYTKPPSTNTELFATVDWPKVATSGDIQQATVLYDDQWPPTTFFPDDSTYGTRIVMRKVRESWDESTIKDLANQLWSLQSPFGHETNAPNTFAINFESRNQKLQEAFQQQASAVRDVGWYARIKGELQVTKGNPRASYEVSVDFSGDKICRHTFDIDPCHITTVRFEILVYHTTQKQKRNISVADLRDYLSKWGGVQVYNDGFRLDYYGNKENDWLGLERDHAHRLSVSALLPESMQAHRGMNYLPTASRLFGAVNVSTSQERQRASVDGMSDDCLTILITRDRLVPNRAYRDLQRIVRTAVDYYAAEEAKRKAIEPKGPALQEKTRNMLEVLEQHRATIPRDAYMEIKATAVKTAEAGKGQDEALVAHMGLLGALATAGISALAYEHEVSKQLRLLEDLAKRMRSFQTTDKKAREFLGETATETDQWLARVRATRALFSNLADQENRETRVRLRARPLLEMIRTQVRPLLHGVPIDVSEVNEELRLPDGTFAEWAALFQNVFFNAANAMLDRPEKKITVLSRRRGPAWQVLIQDTGYGVDLKRAAELFEPFMRKLKVSQGRKGLVIGGMGLGLTIVRMMATTLRCRVEFTEPDEGYNTAFLLSWSEKA